MELEEMLHLSGIALMFAAEPKTVGVFFEWAKKEHEKITGGGCNDPDCRLNNGTVEEWQKLLEEGYKRAARLIITIREEGI